MSNQYVTTSENFGQLMVIVNFPFQYSENIAYEIKDLMQSEFSDEHL